MSHTPGQFMADSGITRDEIEAEKRRMLDEIRLYELKEARKAGISPQTSNPETRTISRSIGRTSPTPRPEAGSCGSSELPG